MEHKEPFDINVVVDRIIQGHLHRMSMTRGLVVLDENVKSWREELRDRNIRVKEPTVGMTDVDIKEQLLEHRILITANSKDFLDDATSFEYSIIAAENIQRMSAKDAGKLISKALIGFNLWAKPHSWLLVLQPTGEHKFTELAG